MRGLEGATMLNFALFFEFVGVVTFLWARPRWRMIGPSFLDSYIIGTSLFALGATTSWYLYRAPHSEEVALIGLTASTSSLIGAAFWSAIFRDRFQNLRFWSIAKNLEVSRGELKAITIGLSVSLAVCVAYLIAIATNRPLMHLIISKLSDGDNIYMRLAISGGTYGYLGVGYVKQFRDIIIPALCAAVILTPQYHNRSLPFISLVVCAFSIFVTGDRLFVLVLLLSLSCAYFIVLKRKDARRSFPILLLLPFLGLLVAQIILMTILSGHGSTATNVAAPTQNLPSSHQLDQSKPLTTTVGKRSVMSAVIAQLAERSIMVVPQENARTFEFWGALAPVYGRGWLTDMSGIMPGKQYGVSNTLAVNLGSPRDASSPLALPTDLYYNWGLFGVSIFSFLFALGFLSLDIFIVKSASPILYGCKMVLFFTIPIMYTPYGFVLYGGAVVLVLSMFIVLLRRRYLRFFGITPDL